MGKVTVVRSPSNWIHKQRSDFFFNNPAIWKTLNKGESVQLSDQDYEKVKQFVQIKETKTQATSKQSSRPNVEQETQTASIQSSQLKETVKIKEPQSEEEKLQGDN